MVGAESHKNVFAKVNSHFSVYGCLFYPEYGLDNRRDAGACSLGSQLHQLLPWQATRRDIGKTTEQDVLTYSSMMMQGPEVRDGRNPHTSASLSLL